MTRADRLRDEGWIDCPTCQGSGDEMEDSMSAIGIPGGHVIVGPCPTCVDGLVPPEWMVTFAADEVWDKEMAAFRDPRYGGTEYTRDEYLDSTRRILITAHRAKEPKPAVDYLSGRRCSEHDRPLQECFELGDQ